MGACMSKLVEVQAALKVEKAQYNPFGKFFYRSKEDILDAAKPLCHERGLALLVEDEIVEVGGRVYCKSRAYVVDMETGESVGANGWAREQATKKGMDESQVTGTASSYAGKRALGNLFAIDDTKDADDPAAAGQRQGVTGKCASCGKAYSFASPADFQAWAAAGAERCCQAPAWRLA